MVQEKTHRTAGSARSTAGLVATVEDGRGDGSSGPTPTTSCRAATPARRGSPSHEITHDPDRILHPMKRTAGRLAAHLVGAGDRARSPAKLNAIRAAHGPDAIALYTGNPSGYAYAHRIYSANWIKAARQPELATAPARRTTWPTSLPARFLYGASFRQPIPDVDRAKYPPRRRRRTRSSRRGRSSTLVDAKARLKAVGERGGKVVVIDPRRTETARSRREHHFIRPGTDAFLLLAMIRTILEREPRGTATSSRDTPSDVEWLRDARRDRSRPSARRDADRHRRGRRSAGLAREIATSPAACAFRPRGVRAVRARCRHGRSTSLNIVTGNLDRPGGAVFSDGLVDLAATVASSSASTATASTAAASVTCPASLGELPAGVLADEIATPGPGRIRALVVTAGNPVARSRTVRRSPTRMRAARVHGRDRHPDERDGGAGRLLPARRDRRFEREDFRSST